VVGDTIPSVGVEGSEAFGSRSLGGGGAHMELGVLVWCGVGVVVLTWSFTD